MCETVPYDSIQNESFAKYDFFAIHKLLKAGFKTRGIHSKTFTGMEEIIKLGMDNEEALDYLKHFCWLTYSDDKAYIRHGSYHHRCYLVDAEKEEFYKFIYYG